MISSCPKRVSCTAPPLALLYGYRSSVPPSCEPSPLRPLPALLEDAPFVALPAREPVELLVGPARVKVHRAVAANTLQPGQGKVHGRFLLYCASVAVYSLRRMACIYETIQYSQNCYDIMSWEYQQARESYLQSNTVLNLRKDMRKEC